jgi:hypothetical protein
MESCLSPTEPAPETSEDRASVDGTSKRSKQKSAITNGSRLLPGIDGRSTWVRRCRDIITDLANDHGGTEMVSAAELNLIRRSATLTTELEMLEAKFANAGQSTPDDLDLYTRAAGNLRRMLEAIGIKRDPTRARNVTPIEDLIEQFDDRDSATATEATEAEVVEP